MRCPLRPASVRDPGLVDLLPVIYRNHYTVTVANENNRTYNAALIASIESLLTD